MKIFTYLVYFYLDAIALPLYTFGPVRPDVPHYTFGKFQRLRAFGPVPKVKTFLETHFFAKKFSPKIEAK